MKRVLTLLIPVFAAILIVLLILYGFGTWSAQLRSHLFPGDKITGTITMSDRWGNVTQTFSHPGGKGAFSFLCGTPEEPVTIIVDSRQDWYQIDVQLEAGAIPDAFRVQGHVFVGGFAPFHVDEYFKDGEDAVIRINCFP